MKQYYQDSHIITSKGSDDDLNNDIFTLKSALKYGDMNIYGIETVRPFKYISDPTSPYEKYTTKKQFIQIL